LVSKNINYWSDIPQMLHDGETKGMMGKVRQLHSDFKKLIIYKVAARNEIRIAPSRRIWGADVTAVCIFNLRHEVG
jgi:hypothetical protein